MLKENKHNRTILDNANKTIQQIEELQVKEYVEELEKSELLKKWLKDLEASRQLTQIDHDEYFYTWVRIDGLNDLINITDALQDQALEQVLDHACLDIEHQTIQQCEGPVFILHTGGVYDQDSNKVIISRSDYDFADDPDDVNEFRRNKLINEYMEKHGYFPSVISCDRYGNAHYVNIQNKGA